MPSTMGSGASTAAFRGRQDSSSTGRRAEAAVPIQGRSSRVDPTRDSKTDWSRSKSAATGEEVGGGEIVRVPSLCLNPNRKPERGPVDEECATVPSSCVVSPRDTSIRAIALRHLAALSLLESFKLAEEDSMYRRTLQHRVFDSW